MGFVPNALWVVMRQTGDRYFFSSFLYRDDCFDLLFSLLPKRLPLELGQLGEESQHGQQQHQHQHQHQHQKKKKHQQQGGKKYVSWGPETAGSGASVSGGKGEGAGVKQRKKKPSLSTLPPQQEEEAVVLSSSSISTTTITTTTTTIATAAAAATTTTPALPPALPLKPLSLPDDATVQRMNLLTDEELDCGVSLFLAEFWGGGREGGREEGRGDFYQAYLQDRGDKEVKVGGWVGREEQDAYSGESFVNVRDVFYSRVRDGRGIGPKTVPTRECQMYRVEGEGGREGGEEDRVFISTALTFTGVPYGDYFYVQTRWVITRVGVEGKRCRLQIGLDVVFRQTVFLKAAIQAATIAETKKTLQDWLARAKARMLVMKKEPVVVKVVRPLAGGTEGGQVGGGGQEGVVPSLDGAGRSTGSKGEETMANGATGAGNMAVPHLPEEQQQQQQQHREGTEGKCATCVFCRLSSSLSSSSSALLLIVPALLLLLILFVVVLLLMRMERLTLQVQSLQEEIGGVLGATRAIQQPVV